MEEQVGSFALSVLHHGGNWIAFARFIPNPLASAWHVCTTEAEAQRWVDTWAAQVRGVIKRNKMQRAVEAAY